MFNHWTIGRKLFTSVAVVVFLTVGVGGVAILNSTSMRASQREAGVAGKRMRLAGLLKNANANLFASEKAMMVAGASSDTDRLMALHTRVKEIMATAQPMTGGGASVARQTEADEYTSYVLLAPQRQQFRILYDVTATRSSSCARDRLSTCGSRPEPTTREPRDNRSVTGRFVPGLLLYEALGWAFLKERPSPGLSRS